MQSAHSGSVPPNNHPVGLPVVITRSTLSAVEVYYSRQSTSARGGWRRTTAAMPESTEHPHTVQGVHGAPMLEHLKLQLLCEYDSSTVRTVRSCMRTRTKCRIALLRAGFDPESMACWTALLSSRDCKPRPLSLKSAEDLHTFYAVRLSFPGHNSQATVVTDGCMSPSARQLTL